MRVKVRVKVVLVNARSEGVWDESGESVRVRVRKRVRV